MIGRATATLAPGRAHYQYNAVKDGRRHTLAAQARISIIAD